MDDGYLFIAIYEKTSTKENLPKKKPKKNSHLKKKKKSFILSFLKVIFS